MANDINNFNFSGRLTRDAEYGMTSNEKQYLRFSIAVNSFYNGENHPSFFPIIVWGKSAEYLSQRLKKGMLVCVSGRIANNIWKDKDGNTRRDNSFIANQVVFCNTGDDNVNDAIPGEDEEF